MKKLPTLAALALCAALPARAQPVENHLTPAEAEREFRRANDACLKEDYKGGIEGYEALVRSGWGSADVLFNLGTAHLRQGRLGFAVLYLERALRLDPSDADARSNLEAAQKLRVDRLVGTPEEAGGEEPFTSRLTSYTNGENWAVAFLILWVAGALALLGRRWARAGLRVWLLLGGLAAVAASLPCGAVTAVHALVESGAHDAVIVAQSLPVREGPQESFKAGFEVHEGLKVRLVDRDGRFVRIRLTNGLQGWVPSEGAAPISP